jgi:hypothetical protein
VCVQNDLCEWTDAFVTAFSCGRGVGYVSVSRLCRRRCNLHAIGNINSLLDGTYFGTIVCLSVCSAVSHNATPTKCIYISLQRGKSVTTVVICVSNQKFIIQQPFRDDVLNNSERVSPFITSPNLSANMNIH